MERSKKYKEKLTNEEIEPITPFNFNDDAHKLEELHLIQKDDKLQKELWHWHLKLNHLSFAKIIFMVLQGQLPKRLNTTDVLFSNMCL